MPTNPPAPADPRVKAAWVAFLNGPWEVTDITDMARAIAAADAASPDPVREGEEALLVHAIRHRAMMAFKHDCDAEGRDLTEAADAIERLSTALAESSAEVERLSGRVNNLETALASAREQREALEEAEYALNRAANTALVVALSGHDHANPADALKERWGGGMRCFSSGRRCARGCSRRPCAPVRRRGR